MNFNTVDDLLDFAISEEEKASKFYVGLADRMDRPWMKKIFIEFSMEELGHKAVLVGIKKGGDLQPLQEQILDLKILEGLHSEEIPADNIDYQQALIIAMQAEKESYILYTSLAELAQDEKAKNVLYRLAQEEAKHKLRFEMEYDDMILTEN
ncbi:MAG: rubrerythrin [Acidobacteria bacterium CG_4_9_14_3_um_filter_49_7]|nr:MAG: rubrerythrin [Acidobacteria bacterium CG_4_9_14_3_um_filter_49_7]